LTEDFEIPLLRQKRKTQFSCPLAIPCDNRREINEPAGIIFLISIAVMIAMGIAGFGTMFIAGMLGVLIGLPIVYAIVCIPSFGILFLLVMSYFIFGVIRLGFDFPVGTLMDGIQVLTVNRSPGKTREE
jgi:hypothetical protein